MARRPVPMAREGADRRALRRVAAGLCLVLALLCLIAAAATLHAQPVPGEAEATTVTPLRSRLPVVLPVFLAFVLVLAAVTRWGPPRRAGQRSGGGVSATA